MAAKTYLDLVNKVLIRMRENQVTSVDQNKYSALIGAFVNKAKKDVEMAWNWEGLRTTFTVTTVAGTQRYYLTDLRTDKRTMLVWNDTNDHVVMPLSLEEANVQALTGTPESSSDVQHYFWNGLNSSEDVGVDLFPVPSNVQVLRFVLTAPPDDLEDDTDLLYIPYQPVVELAVAYAKGERGEDGGASSLAEATDASRVLADWVATEAADRTEEVTWRVV